MALRSVKNTLLAHQDAHSQAMTGVFSLLIEFKVDGARTFRDLARALGVKSVHQIEPIFHSAADRLLQTILEEAA